MKKHGLLKAIAISFLIVVVLSWIVPTGSFSSTTFTDNGTIPVGIINIFRLPVMTIQTFIQYVIVLLAIGGFYGILNKTGVYGKIVNGFAKKMKGKEKVVLIVVTVLFALLASLTGLSMLLVAVVPFAAAVILTLGYGKITAMLSTIGAILVGQAGSTLGFSGAGYIKNVFSINMTDEIITRIILFVLLVGLFVFFIVKGSENKKAVKASEINLLYAEDKKDKSALPLIIISVLLFILCAVGMYNWYYAFGIQAFNTFHTTLTGIKIGSYPIVSNLLSGISSLGYWGNYELSITLVIASVIIGWLYNVSVEDYIEGFKKGVKDMLPVAFIAVMANVVFTVMLSNEGSMNATIVNWLGGFAKSFNLPIVAVMTFVESLFHNDLYYLLTDASGVLSTYDAVYYPIIGVVVTAIHNITMMVLPTSVLLMIGLKYFDISLGEWLKTIWKYVLEALVVVILVAIVVVVLI